MSEPVSASFEDIKTLCPGADSDFICAQLEKKATADQAQSAWMEEQNQRIEAAEQRAKEAEEKAKEAETKTQAPGNDPVEESFAGSETSGGGNPIERFTALVREKEKSLSGPPQARRQKATVIINQEHPGLADEVRAFANK